MLAGAFSKLKRGKRLTFDDMKELKANLELQVDGTLQPRYLKMETEADAANDSSWALRIKTWEQLKRFGRFEEISTLSDIPLDDLDFAARYGDYQWYGGSNGAENIKCQNLDWAAIQTAIDKLSGRERRWNKLRVVRRKAEERKEKHRGNRKIATLLRELQMADFVVFGTESLNSCPMDDDGEENEFEMQDGLEVISRGFTSPAVEYWEAPARKQRAKAATATCVAKHRRAKMTPNP